MVYSIVGAALQIVVIVIWTIWTTVGSIQADAAIAFPSYLCTFIALVLTALCVVGLITSIQKIKHRETRAVGIVGTAIGGEGIILGIIMVLVYLLAATGISLADYLYYVSLIPSHVLK